MSFIPSMPGLSPYENGQAELLKALQVGQPGIAPANAGGLVYQDLSNTITTLTSTMQDLVFYPSIPKETATSTVYEWNSLLSYGSNGSDSIFQQEVDVPLDDSANYQKNALALKFIGKRGYVSDAARLVNAVVDLETQETMTQGQALLRSLEFLLYKGDSTLNPLAFDGFDTLIRRNSPSTNIYDVHGGDLSFDIVSNLAAVLRDNPNYARLTDFHCNKTVQSAYNRTFYPLGRYGLTDGGSRTINMDIAGASDSSADYKITGSAFIQAGATMTINQNQDFTKSPSAPTVGAPANAPAAAGQTSFFLASDAGQYLWSVQAVNRFGKSPIVAANTSAQTVNAGDVVTFTVTMGGTNKPDYFIIFRTDKTAAPSTFGEVARVANVIGAQGPAAVPVIDSNYNMPGCTSAYFFEYSADVMSWVSLMSLMKIDLAKVRTSKDFMLTAIGAPLLRAPTKVGMLRNIRRPRTALGQ